MFTVVVTYLRYNETTQHDFNDFDLAYEFAKSKYDWFHDCDIYTADGRTLIKSFGTMDFIRSVRGY